jgi:Transposase IS116/IS110/IS902 family
VAVHITEIALPEPIRRTRADIKAARAEAANLSIEEVRYLVDFYYETQEYRISAGNQVTALAKTGEPIALLDWVKSSLGTVEKEVGRSLDYYTQQEPTGLARWARAIPGIGPVLSAGLLAHINLEMCTTVGQLWSFAGLNPEQRWNKGEKRPWNARLKLLTYKLGESFVKVQAHADDVYGAVYATRKVYEIANNEAGRLADQAQAMLSSKKIRTSTDAYKAYSQGKLPPAHIHARARRYAVKLFLSHYHEVGTWLRTGQLPPSPYALAILDHVDYIPPPFLDLVPGLADARAQAQKTVVPGRFAPPPTASELDG